jgi:anti-sigma factor RsiW
MNCEDSKNLMTVSVYGKLTSSEKDRLEAHLLECARCAGQYEKVKKVTNLFSEKEDVLLPDKEESWRVVSADVFRRRPRWRASYPANRPVFVFSLALSLLVVGFAAGYLVRSGWQRDGEMAQLRREVLEVREITAASFVRQESLNMGLRGMRAESLAAPSEEKPRDFVLRALLGDPVSRQEFLDSLAEQTSPVVEIALALARHMERL